MGKRERQVQAMIFEGDYFYKGAERLSWGFGSPNQLGAFFAAAIPVLWSLMPARATAATQPAKSRPKSKRSRTVSPSPERQTPRQLIAKSAVWLAEAGLWLGIGATASRGAAVAALGAAFVWCVGHCWANRTTWYAPAGWLGLRVAACIIGLAVFSFGGRITPEFLANDDSIGNRFILWTGAARLIAASPWTGWGVEESGNAFMQWVQPIDRTEVYRTTVNSFLHVGVEDGLLWLGVVLLVAILGASWALAWEKFIERERIKLLVRAASCVIFSWVLSNVFSTLFKDWRLWIFPVLALVWLCVSMVFTRAPWRRVAYWLGGSLAASTIACVAVWLIGVTSESRQVIHLAHPTKDAIVLRDSKANDIRWGLCVDTDVFGDRYGHELRRWGNRVIESGTPWSIAVFDGRFWKPTSDQTRAHHWILAGEAANQADALGSANFIVFLHPRGDPPQTWAGKGMLILNGIDEDGSREAWMQWAAWRRLRIESVAGVGLDARAVWPAAYMEAISSIR